MADWAQRRGIWKPKNTWSNNEPVMQFGFPLMDNGSWAQRSWRRKPQNIGSNDKPSMECALLPAMATSVTELPSFPGIGIAKNELVNNLGTTASVGFYSTYFIKGKVRVVTKRSGNRRTDPNLTNLTLQCLSSRGCASILRDATRWVDFEIPRVGIKELVPGDLLPRLTGPTMLAGVTEHRPARHCWNTPRSCEVHGNIVVPEFRSPKDLPESGQVDTRKGNVPCDSYLRNTDVPFMRMSEKVPFQEFIDRDSRWPGGLNCDNSRHDEELSGILGTTSAATNMAVELAMKIDGNIMATVLAGMSAGISEAAFPNGHPDRGLFDRVTISLWNILNK